MPPPPDTPQAAPEPPLPFGRQPGTQDTPAPHREKPSRDDEYRDPEKEPYPDPANRDKEERDESADGNDASTATVARPQQLPAHGDPPPDGGLQAWLQVAGAFMIFFNSWGLLNTFGVFQTYYESGALFTESSSNISWIGSLQAYFVLLGGLVSGPLYDRGYLRSLIVGGSFFVVFGHMMLSMAETYWQALLAQGFCVGIGAGMFFAPALGVLPAYFSSRLGLAIGLSAAGSSFGGVIYPIVFYRLIAQVGFQWGVRVIGFIALATCSVPIMFMRQRIRPLRARAVFDTTAFTDVPFVVFLVAVMLGFVGLYVMLLFLSFYGESTGVTDASMSFYIVPILNAASMFGRTLPNWLSDKTGGFNMIIPGSLVCGVLVLCMQGVSSLGSIIAIAILFGFFSGVYVALPPVLMVALTEDKSRLGTRLGMAFAFFGFGSLAGGPGGGAILGQTGGGENWTGLWVYGGVTLLASAAMLTGLRCWKYGTGLMIKA